MKNYYIKLTTTLFILSISSNNLLAHEEVGAAKVGNEYAIIKADHEKGIQLSAQTLKKFSITFQSIKNNQDGVTTVPSSAIVYSEDKTFIYKLTQDWIQKVPVKILKKDGTQFNVSITPILKGDSIATTGIGIIRAAELEAFGDEVHEE